MCVFWCLFQYAGLTQHLSNLYLLLSLILVSSNIMWPAFLLVPSFYYCKTANLSLRIFTPTLCSESQYPNTKQNSHTYQINSPSNTNISVTIQLSHVSIIIRTAQPIRCNVSQFIYFCKTLYMFQTVFPSIIRSSKLHIQRQVFVRPLLLPAASLEGQQQVAVTV